MTTKERIAKALAVATDTKVFEMDSNILHRAPAIFKEQFGDARAIVVADKNTWRVAGEEVFKHLVDAKIEVSEHIIRQDEFHAEWCYVVEVEEAAKEAGAIIVAVVRALLTTSANSHRTISGSSISPYLLQHR